jgi:tRNA pseudouridine38-40 synthase
MRFRATIDYRGTNFAGWQSQPNAITVQSAIEEALTTYSREKVKIVGCGRTDAGVHAQNYVFHFDLESDLSERDLRGINALLGSDIALKLLERTSDDFHARYSCKSRRYRYEIHGEKDPFLQGLSYFFIQFDQLNRDAMELAAQVLVGEYDFYTFCKSNSDVDHCFCKVTRAEWEWKERGAVFRIEANRFLRGMVRLIVGMCLQVGLGKLEVEEMSRFFFNRERLPQPLSAPAEGLYLEYLQYGQLHLGI